ncbi:MAG: hypothetical protein PHQ40_19700, partial [Anaerolineaceae bacterium]|nr:hypothetical protein [Anaerolineaceae bacterium]
SLIAPTAGLTIPAAGGVSSPRSSYQFTSRTDQCGWGVNDGQVVFGKLYVSPGFNLRQWLKYNPGVTFTQLQLLNKYVRFGPQFTCATIELPSM